MDTRKRLSNKEVVSILREALAAMEVKDFNRFRIRAYQDAVSAIDNLTSGIYDLWEDGRLDAVQGFGSSLIDHLNELFSTGKVVDFEKYKEGLPEGMFSLLGVRGIGAKTAYKLATAFKLSKRESALNEVKKAAENGKIRMLAGFGEKSEKDILESIENLKKTKETKQRILLVKAEEIAERIAKYMNTCPEMERMAFLGSLRRRSATIGDLDIAVATNNPKDVIRYFLEFPEISEVMATGDKKASVLLKNEMQVDVRVIHPQAFGSMMQYFTGNKQHNVLLRSYALELGLSLSEYGIKKGNKLEEFEDEEQFYGRMGLQYIPPEIRHGTNEIHASRSKGIPELVRTEDIRGDLHTHTTASDGISTLAEMVEEAKSLGYEYFGVCDHAPSVQARGKFDVIGIITGRRKEVEQINYSQDKIRVLLGYEVNILADSTISLPDEILDKLDYVIASIHTALDQDRELITKRLIIAIENPFVTVIGHPSGRLINEREACDVDWAKVFDSAVKHNKILEINAQPNRLDLADDLVTEAVGRGVRLIINTDAHSVPALSLMRYGVDVARRGWCTKRNILNTLPKKEFIENFLRKV